MKKVFTSADDVIHLFARRSQDEARHSNYQVYFNNKYKIYSYGSHYELGQFLDNNTIIINDRGYSKTTAGHINSITWGTSQYKRFFYTKVCLDYVYNRINRDLVPKLEVARKPQLYTSEILDLWKTLNEFFDYFTKLKKSSKTWYDHQFINGKLSIWFDSESMLFSKQDVKYRLIKKLVKNITNDSGNYINDIQAFKRIELKKVKAKNLIRIKKSLKEFYNYEIRTFRIGNFDFVRLSQDKQYIETT